MLTAAALLASLLAATLAAGAWPTRVLGRTPAPARRRAALLLLPVLGAAQFATLAARVGPAAAGALLACAWMVAGWAFTVLLERRPHTLRAIGYGIGGAAALATAWAALAAVAWARA